MMPAPFRFRMHDVLICVSFTASSHAGTVTGTIMRAGIPPTPVANARVTIFDPTLSFFQEVRSSAAGQYSFTSVPSGTWRLGACSRDLEYSEVSVTVGAGALQQDFNLNTET